MRNKKHSKLTLTMQSLRMLTLDTRELARVAGGVRTGDGGYEETDDTCGIIPSKPTAP